MRQNDNLNCTAYRFILSEVLLNSFGNVFDVKPFSASLASHDEALLGDALGACLETPCVLNPSPTRTGLSNPHTVLT